VINFTERKKRFFEEIESKQEIFLILKEKFSSAPMKIKYDIEDNEVRLSDFSEIELAITVDTFGSYKTTDGHVLICSALLDKYFEVEFEIKKEIEPGKFRCLIQGARRATSGRSDIRFRVKPGDVYATNFRVSKHSIDLTMFKLPTGIKVILDQFATHNKSRFDFFEIGYFDKKDTLLNNMKKTGNSFYIENLANPDTYAPITDEFINYSDLMADEANDYIYSNKERNFKSILIVPIVYITPNEQSIPFAYIKIMTKERLLSIDDFLKIKEHSFKLIDRIRDANTQFIDKRQSILDISRGGASLKIDDPELKKYLLKAKGFIFDLVFKLQQPVTIYGEIKFTGADDHKNILLGLSFSGNSSRKNQMQHLYSVLKPMEINYKKKLIEQIRRKQAQSPPKT
jgi:hypothetical protein